MGAEYSTYIGIYLEIPYQKKETKVTTFKHPETGHKMKSKFCGQTGVEGVPHTRIDTSYDSPQPWIYEDGFDREDTFWGPESSIGNQVRKQSDKFATFLVNDHNKYNINCDRIDNCDFAEIDTQKLIEEFKIEYKKHIDYYTKEFGEVEISYGLVNYAH